MANAKTLRKRIALVAAAALGVGLLVAAPASAAFTAATGTLTVTPTLAVVNTPLGGATTTAASSTAGFTVGFTGISGDVETVTASVSSPSGATAPTLAIGSGATTGSGTTETNTATTATVTSAGTAAVTGTFTLALTVTNAGQYVVTLTPDAAGVAAGMPTKTITYNFQSVWAVTGDGLSGGTQANSTVNAVAGPANTVTLGASEQGTTPRLVTVSGAGATIANATATPWTVASNGLSAVLAIGTAGAVAPALVINTPTAGTATVSSFEQSTTPGIYSTTPTSTVTITVNAAAVNGTAVVANSTAILNTGATTGAITDATVVADKLAGVEVANIAVVLKDALKNNATGALTVVITGPGTAGVGTVVTAPSTGRSFTGTATASSQFVSIWADGSAGVSTITVSVGSTVLTTKTVTFTGPIATLAATNVTTVNKVGVNTGSVTVLAKDANGNVLPNVTVYGSSATTTVATIPASAVTSSLGVASFDLTGVASGTSVLTFGNLATAPTVSTTSTVTVALSTASTITLTLDKATYAPGAKAVLTLTAKDANGNLMADGTYTLLTSAGLVSSTAISSTPALPTNGSVTLSGGTEVWNLYAPLVAGPFSINGTTAAAGGVVNTAAVSLPLVASANVVGAATDTGTAANSAAIAALQTSVAALSTTIATLVASITAQISALSALVKKILAQGGTRGSGSPKLPATGRK